MQATSHLVEGVVQILAVPLIRNPDHDTHESLIEQDFFKERIQKFYRKNWSVVLSLNEEGLAGENMKSAVNVYDGPVHRLGCNEFGKFTCLRKIQIHILNIFMHCN